MQENEMGTIVVNCAIHLHQDLGPGLLEIPLRSALGSVHGISR